MEDMDREDHPKPSEDEGEVVFSQQEERATTTGPYGPEMDRQNENGWLEDTKPYHGAQPRMIDVNQSVDDVLGAQWVRPGRLWTFVTPRSRSCLRSNKSGRKAKSRRHHDGSHAEMEGNDRKDPGS